MKFYCANEKGVLACETFAECSKAGVCAMAPVPDEPMRVPRKPRINKLDKRGASWRVLWYRDENPTSHLFWTWRSAVEFALDLTTAKGMLTGPTSKTKPSVIKPDLSRRFKSPFVV